MQRQGGARTDSDPREYCVVPADTFCEAQSGPSPNLNGTAAGATRTPRQRIADCTFAQQQYCENALYPGNASAAAVCEEQLIGIVETLPSPPVIDDVRPGDRSLCVSFFQAEDPGTNCIGKVRVVGGPSACKKAGQD